MFGSVFTCIDKNKSTWNDVTKLIIHENRKWVNIRELALVKMAHIGETRGRGANMGNEKEDESQNLW